MYIGHARLCVCVCVSLAACPYYCTDPDVTWENGMGCPQVVHYWTGLQSVSEFRCYDNIARTQNASECLYSLYACFSQTASMRRLRTDNLETFQHDV